MTIKFSQLRVHTLCAAVLCIWGAWTLAAVAQLPQTRLTVVFPPGGQRGSDVSVTIDGEMTENATGLIFSHPGITATQQLDPESEYRVVHRRPKTFNVQVSPEVLSGAYEVRAIGPTGLSNPRLFSVTGLPESQFNANENRRDNPFTIEINQIVNARTRADQRDYYRFDANQGQTLLVQVLAERIDSQLDAGLAIYDESGTRLARTVHGKTKDPIIAFTVPADGSYLIEVWDLTFRGGGLYPYRLEVSDRPYVDTVFPAVARAGEEAEFTVYGYNLPAGNPVSGSSRVGNLQSRTVRFSPQSDESFTFADGLARSEICSAMLDGIVLRMPKDLYRADPIFMGLTSDPLNEEAKNDVPEEAQRITTPCEIAGRFYPRRDVDWYEFAAKKNDSFWIGLSSQRLGTTCDVSMRIRQKLTAADGTVQYRELNTTDDLDGAPKSRSARRFHSGSNDAAYEFRAAEDGVFQVSVRDLYNTTWDDPRLVYHLAIKPASPDFQLVAFPAPDRHPDDKIVNPCGVSILPGGTSTVVVRLLPRHGFREAVELVAEDLPPGVTASSTVLPAGQVEGQIVLRAAKDARPTANAVRITGRTRRGGKDLERIAKTGVIRWNVGNVDSEATDVRLSRDLVVAVVDSTPPAVMVDVAKPLVATSVGAKITVPVRLNRREGFDAELELAAFEPPKGIKVDAVKSKSDTGQLQIAVEDAKLAPGVYTLLLNTKVKEKRPRNTVVVREAEADLRKIESLLAERNARLTADEAKRKDSSDLVLATEQKLAGAQQAIESARANYVEKLKVEQQAVAELANILASAITDVASTEVRDAVDAAEARVDALRQERTDVQASLEEATKPLTAATALLAEQQASVVKADKELIALRAARDEAEKQRQETEKRHAELKKAQLEQEHEYWIYSSPILLEVRPTPISVQLATSPIDVQLGQEVTIPVRVVREFGFEGQISLSAKAADNSQLTASPLVLGAGQEFAKIVLEVGSDASPGRHDIKIEAALNFNGIDMTAAGRATVNVVEKKQQE